MNSPLFSISCTTCQARLAVRNEAAIGEIVECPKCGSFVQIVPPEGWRKPEPPPQSQSPSPAKPPAAEPCPPKKPQERPPEQLAPASSAPSPPPKASESPAKPPVAKPPVSAKSPPAAPDAPSPAAGAKPPIASDALRRPEPPPAYQGAVISQVVVGAAIADEPSTETPPVPSDASHPAESGASSPSPPEVDSSSSETVATQPPEVRHSPSGGNPSDSCGPLGSRLRGNDGQDAAASTPLHSAEAPSEPIASPGSRWVSPVEQMWRRWLLVGSVPVASLVLVAGLWSVLSSGSAEPAADQVNQTPVKQAAAAEPDPSEPVPEPSPSETAHLRWVPRGARLLAGFHPARMLDWSHAGRLLDEADPIWQQSGGPVLRSLGLKLHTVRRFTWATVDLGKWPGGSVAIIELVPGQDAGRLKAIGEPFSLSVAGSDARRLADAEWSHPLVVVGPRTIVTGEAALLRELAEMNPSQPAEGPWQSPVIERLVKMTEPTTDAIAMVDLEAARAAGWQLPEAWFDVWPAGKQAWRVLWEMPSGLGGSLHWSDHLRTEVALVCEGETTAEQVRQALDEVVAKGSRSMAARLDVLPKRLRAGQVTANQSHSYESLLTASKTALESARSEVVDAVVWLQLTWPQQPTLLATAALDSRGPIRLDWLAAARAVEHANYRQMLDGLGGYRKAEGRFPPAALGGSLLPPETRLSWIAEMLPYLGHAAWHRELRESYKWNGSQNGPIARQPLPPVINPALGPSTTEAGFPVTHYVGVSGVGADAGELSADNSRAGVFRFGRPTRPEEIADGASNTMAILGVTKDLGAWAAGGRPTVRPLTRPPYVNGPDGFGSGQPDGMLVGMADGSVRFVSKDVDPRVLEQLATIQGGEPARVAELRPASDWLHQFATQSEPAEGDAVPEEVAVEETEEPATPEEDDTSGVATLPVAPPKIDVVAQLAEPVLGFEVTQMPLIEAVDLLSSLSAVPITLDLDALEQLGMSVRDPVTVNLQEASLKELFRQVAAARRLQCVVAQGQVLMTAPTAWRQDLREVRYTVADLTGNDPAAVDKLADVVRTLVAPECWASAGGRGSIDSKPGVLVIEQSAPVHSQLLVFCEKLRNARGKPLRSRLDPARFALTTRYQQAKEVLARPVSVNFHHATPLAEVVDYLAGTVQADVLIDRVALAEVGLSDQAEVSFTAEQQPWGVVMEEMLRALGLGYRLFDAGTLQVTTLQRVGTELELEFYPIGPLLDQGQTPEALIERIKGGVAGGTWSDAGGPGAIHFDRPGRCFIVLQSQPVQAAVERLLGEKPQ